MKFNLYFYLLFLFFFQMNVTAQNSGYLGKKNILSAEVRIFNPSVYNFFNRDNENLKYELVSSAFKYAPNPITYGFNGTIGRTISNKVAFLLQFSTLKYKMTTTETYEYDYSILRATYLNGSANGIMPIFEFAGQGGILPIGLTHQVGLGFYRHKITEDEYRIDQYSTGPIDQTIKPLFLYEKFSVQTYSIMYKMNLRIPISRRILYNVGLRYNLNLSNSVMNYSNSTQQSWFTERYMRKLVSRTNLLNVLSLETGFSFTF